MPFLRALFDDLLGLRVAEREPDRPDALHGEPWQRPHLGDSAARREGLGKDKCASNLSGQLDNKLTSIPLALQRAWCISS